MFQPVSGGRRRKRNQPSKPINNSTQPSIEAPRTIVKTLNRTLKPVEYKKCVPSPAVSLPRFADNSTLNQHIDLLLEVGRLDDAKFLAVNAFEEFKELVWEYMGKKMQEALGKSEKVVAPSYIVNIGVHHAFKLADENMNRFHNWLINQFVTEFIQMTKSVKTPKSRKSVIDKMKQRLQDYAFRTYELECLFQKGLAFLNPKANATANKNTNGGNTLPYNNLSNSNLKQKKTAPASQQQWRQRNV